MPILDVEMLGPREDGLAQRIADAAGAVFGTPPGRTWVRLRFLAPADYAENGTELPADVRPAFVKVLKAQRPADAAAEIAALTTAIAEAVNRPRENVHVLYEPPAAGRAAFGGELVDGQ